MTFSFQSDESVFTAVINNLFVADGSDQQVLTESRVVTPFKTSSTVCEAGFLSKSSVSNN